MRLSPIAVTTASLILASVSAFGGQATETQLRQAAANYCGQQINKLGLPIMAYYQPGTQLFKTYGTADARFLFGACMTDLGFELYDR